MRVASYAGDATILVAEADPVPPGPADVQIAVAFTGIRGTDLHIRHGSMDARVRVPAVLAQELGMAVLDPSRTDIESRIQDRTGGAGVAVAFEVSGTRPGLATALSVLGARGRMVAVGIHPIPQMIDMQRVFLRELSLLGARVYERSDFERAVQLIAEGTVPAGRLVSRVEPLGSAAEAFSALESGDGVMKVLVDCRGDEG